MKDAVSDGIKRCAFRLGLGLHLQARLDYFLYDQLHKQNAEAGTGALHQRNPGRGEHRESRPLEAPTSGADVPGSTPASASASSPAGNSVGEHPTADAGGVGSPAAPPTSKARIQTLVARSASLRADGVDVYSVQANWQLPDIGDSDEKQLAMWDELLRDEEMKLSAPFEEATA